MWLSGYEKLTVQSLSSQIKWFFNIFLISGKVNNIVQVNTKLTKCEGFMLD